MKNKCKKLKKKRDYIIGNDDHVPGQHDRNAVEKEGHVDKVPSLIQMTKIDQLFIIQMRILFKDLKKITCHIFLDLFAECLLAVVVVAISCRNFADSSRFAVAFDDQPR